MGGCRSGAEGNAKDDEGGSNESRTSGLHDAAFVNVALVMTRGLKGA